MQTNADYLFLIKTRISFYKIVDAFFLLQEIQNARKNFIMTFSRRRN